METPDPPKMPATRECQVCADDVPAAQICECHSCEFAACQSCVERYTADSMMLSCMSCRATWDRVFVAEKMPRKFMKTAYREMTARAAFEEQRAMLEETLPILDAVREFETISADIAKRSDPAIRAGMVAKIAPVPRPAPYAVRGFCRTCSAAVPENQECCRGEIDPGTLIGCPGCGADVRTDGPEAFCTHCFSLVKDGRATPAREEFEMAVNLSDDDRHLARKSVGSPMHYNKALARVRYYPWHFTNLEQKYVKDVTR